MCAGEEQGIDGEKDAGRAVAALFSSFSFWRGCYYDEVLITG